MMVNYVSYIVALWPMKLLSGYWGEQLYQPNLNAIMLKIMFDPYINIYYNAICYGKYQRHLNERESAYQ